MLTLYGRGHSRSFRALWSLHEAAVAFDYVEVSDEYRQSAAYLAINGQRKVPTLVHADLTLTESAAIVNYAAMLADSGLVPVTPAARARYDDMCYFIMTDLEQPLWTIGKHQFVLPEQWRRQDVLETAAWEFAKSQDSLLSQWGQRQFAVGDSFTMADVLLAQTLNWAERFDMSVDAALLQYRDRQYARPACVASLETIA